MLIFCGQLCQNLLDHVYALLSLVTKEDMDKYEITPDYTKEPIDLFAELVKTLHQLEQPDQAYTISRLLAKSLGVEGVIDVGVALGSGRAGRSIEKASSHASQGSILQPPSVVEPDAPEG